MRVKCESWKTKKINLLDITNVGINEFSIIATINGI